MESEARRIKMLTYFNKPWKSIVIKKEKYKTIGVTYEPGSQGVFLKGRKNLLATYKEYRVTPAFVR